MTPKSGTSNLFLLLWASVAHEEIVSRANGSTFLEISKTNFRPIQVATPSTVVMHKFEELARPAYERIVDCSRESRSLGAFAKRFFRGSYPATCGFGVKEGSLQRKRGEARSETVAREGLRLARAQH